MNEQDFDMDFSDWVTQMESDMENYSEMTNFLSNVKPKREIERTSTTILSLHIPQNKTFSKAFSYHEFSTLLKIVDEDIYGEYTYIIKTLLSLLNIDRKEIVENMELSEGVIVDWDGDSYKGNGW